MERQAPGLDARATQGAPNIISEEANGLAMAYNAQGQMAQVNELLADGSAGALKQKNGYRGDGLRAWKEDASGHRTYFFYAGTTLTAMVSEDQSGTLSPPRQLLWGADGLLGVRWREATGDERASYFLWDTQGNLALSYSETGQLSRSFGFTAYGSPLPDAGGELAQATFGYGGKFGYLRDGETGLVLCTWRFYDPSLGNWTQRDPIGYDGGANLYGYVDGDPANFVDPLGLQLTSNTTLPAYVLLAREAIRNAKANGGLVRHTTEWTLTPHFPTPQANVILEPKTLFPDT